jgi:hypothetical protein
MAPKLADTQTGATYPTDTAIDMQPLPKTLWPGPVTFHRYHQARSWTVMAGGEKGHFLAPVGVWIATGGSVHDPYPCQCKNLEERGRCRDLDNHSMVVERGWRPCPCWGQPVEPGIPGGCCRNHIASRKLHEPETRGPEPAPLTVGVDERWLRTQDEGPLERVATEVAYAEVLEETTVDGVSVGPPVDLLAARRRLEDAGCFCDCKTPWDDREGTTGHHCPDCHRNFVSYAVAQAHSKDWRSPCRDPQTVVFTDTGYPAMYQQAGVWALSRYQPAVRPGFKYE